MTHIFISYSPDSSRDKERALELYNILSERGFLMWMADRDIEAGENLYDAVEAALIESKVVLVVSSHDSVKSSFVKDEVNYALEKKKRVIPLIFEENIDLPFRLRGIKAIDFSAGYQYALGCLIETLTPPNPTSPTLDDGKIIPFRGNGSGGSGDDKISGEGDFNLMEEFYFDSIMNLPLQTFQRSDVDDLLQREMSEFELIPSLIERMEAIVHDAFEDPIADMPVNELSDIKNLYGLSLIPYPDVREPLFLLSSDNDRNDKQLHTFMDRSRKWRMSGNQTALGNHSNYWIRAKSFSLS